MSDFLAKQRRCADKVTLGGTNTVFKPGKKPGDPWVAEHVPNGKIRTTQYMFSYGQKRGRGTTKPE